MKEKLATIGKVIYAVYWIFVCPVLMILGLMSWFHDISEKLGYTK